MMPIVVTVPPPHRVMPALAPKPAGRLVRWSGLAMLAAILMTASPVRAQLAADDCNGLDFDVDKPIVIAKVASSAPRVFYVKSALENASCPADTAACRGATYLVPGDLVLANNLHAPYACITFQSPQAKDQIWSNGWFPSASLVPVAPLSAPRAADWIGTWAHPGGEIRIAQGDNGKFAILGFQAYPGTRNEHTGAMQAEAAPSGTFLAFADDGSKPFGKNEDDCQVRMQRVDALLIVEDNGSCGGAAVTFTGFYRRKP